VGIRGRRSDEEIPSSEEGQAAASPRRSALWRTVALTLVLLTALLIFVLQNTRQVRLRFTWLRFSAPAGVALLLSAVAGALLVFLVGSIRILQLRRERRRQRRER
jgi:uncharacterized integral membrane protein